MKVYALPKEVPAPEVDYANYDSAKVEREEDAHKRQLTEWLRAQGYMGKNTGGIAQFPVADGYAVYMLAEGPGKTACLIHLPYGDGYSYPHIEHLPKKAVLDEIARGTALFGKGAFA